MSSNRTMPNNGVGIVDFKIVNPYTGITINKIGASSGNDTNISKAARYSQYVNNNKGFKNVQRMTYKEYVAKYGPLSNQTIDRSCYDTPAFKPQVLMTNNQKIAPGQEFMFKTNY